VRIGFFLHIPFPPAELFLQIPWRAELVHGMLGADLVGVHTPGDARNVVDIASLVGARVTGDGVSVGRRHVEVGAFPISIDTHRIIDIAARPETDARVTRLRHDLGDPERMILGIDRLDYTKGITNRLRAFRELLADGVVRAPDTVMVQVAVPSRERVGSYANERRRVTTLVGEINGNFGQVGRPAVHYLQRSLPLHELVALYRTADVMLVTPLRDGMNLVAKEFVAARIHHRGALVLSEFAGAAHELTDAFLVNPYDVDGLKAALTAALHITPEEEHRRMTALRQVVLEHDVHRWSASFVHRLERRRRSTHPKHP
jgi:trehalose 6-phosphate synthase